MKINGIQNQTFNRQSFQGIRLSTTDYKEVRTLAFLLKDLGSDLLGKKQLYQNTSKLSLVCKHTLYLYNKHNRHKLCKIATKYYHYT